jgi:2-oxoglutarate ferredoxin oxidoreductase subunit beta
VVVHNNQIYALTKGQAAPTTPRGERTRLQFDGVEVDPARMLATAIVHDCSFVARGFAAEIDELSGILRRAIEHRGLSLVEVIQPCITWGSRSVDEYRERIEPAPADHDPADRHRAIDLALRAPERLVTGVLYETPARPTFAASYRRRVGERPLAELPPIDREILKRRLDEFTVAGAGPTREPKRKDT